MADSALLAGRYALQAVIGTGGMAEVYRADDVKLSRPVAVKLLRDTAGDESDRARFIDEARTLAMLSHSGLVMVLDAGFGTQRQDDGTGPPDIERPFLVMELVEGPTLADRIAVGPMPLADAGAIGAQVAEALAYVHGRGVIHRDVKPGNVLIGPADRVKLADFGIARLVAQATRHTRTGHAIGTAAYLAPEQVRGEEVDGAADVYSLGLVLLEAVTGRREYAGPAAEAAMARLHRSPEVPDLPPAWRDLLVAMTATDPQERPSALEVGETLRAGLARAAPSGSESVPDAMTAPILAAPGATDAAGPGATKPLTAPPPSVPAPTGRGPRPTAPPPGWAPDAPTPTPTREGPTPRERLHGLVGRARAVPPHVRGVAAAVAVLLALLVVVAIASGDGASSELPANTPPELREPLVELREAVLGEDG
ncbi:hypothetical protein HNR19_002497 [Nocardioides thalensis]|uniref:Protein kinase domain-containing protein n=1 Tax=Nocardioides thalensis TaxID=1914755 RepID=A0A853C3B6_9ACTN|nr:hypothetical protein [Nocardioides thalensis]